MRGMSVASSPSPMMVTPPQPNDGFRWVQLASGPALVCEPLEPFVRHFFTTRLWRLGARPPDVRDGWDEIAAAAGIGIEQLRRLHQVHGCDVAVYRKGDAPPLDTPRADIVLTDDDSLAVAVQTADCLPVLIVDRTTRAVAAAHAGWRGLVMSVPSVAVDRMATVFGSRRADLLAAVGPAIGACCYEVGEDVRARFEEQGFPRERIERSFRTAPAAWPNNPPMSSLRRERRPNHWFFDSWSTVREQLISAGVHADHIFGAELCTASHESVFCSYRRDGAIAGRLAGVVRSSCSSAMRP
jgi:purine-nucleoside/S-methyl-5'-thioadenosine phosphorylase / adenosine deaminase